jgi:hypothetical protein
VRAGVPQILLSAKRVRAALESNCWRMSRKCAGKRNQQILADAEAAVKAFEEIEQWIRTHIPEEEWKKVLG